MPLCVLALSVIISLYGRGPVRPNGEDPVDTPPGEDGKVPAGMVGVVGLCANSCPAVVHTNAITAKLFLNVLFIFMILEFIFEEGEVKNGKASMASIIKQLRNYYLALK